MSSTSQQPMITLFRGGLPEPKYVWSPFADKLEARLRIGGLNYKLDAGSPKTGPRGKIPYVSIAQSGTDKAPELMADTTLIITRLIENGLLEDWNADLSPVQKAHDMALRALLEDKLYFYGVYEKWVENYYTMRDKTLGAMPTPVRFVVGNLIYRTMTSTLYGQGTMRYSNEEVQTFRIEIWQTINDLLRVSRESNPPKGKACFWALGRDYPTEFDATLYGFITSGLVCTAAPATQKTIRNFPVLVDYAKRIHQWYFSDFEIWE